MDETPPRRTKGLELRAFLLLSVVMAPVLAVIIVTGYGFLVWMYQLFAGPPGPSPLTRHAARELHIASLVVHVAPAQQAEVLEAVSRMRGARLHGSSPNGKPVVTLEEPPADAMTRRSRASSTSRRAVCGAGLPMRGHPRCHERGDDRMLRREFVRRSAAAAAARRRHQRSRIGQSTGADPSVKWSKAPCRFCGTGCGVTWQSRTTA